MFNLTSRIARATSIVVVTSLLALYAPAESIGQQARDLWKRIPVPPKYKASKDLTPAEMKKMVGRSGANPYWSGSNKWGINIEGVDVTTGNFSTSNTDLSFEGGYGIPVAVSRVYSMNNAEEGPLGFGWTLSVDIRTTAGGVMKSAGAPVRSVPTNMKERPRLERVGTAADSIREPVEAIIATDSSGFEETMQRDVDGVITPPSWDQNQITTVNEVIEVNGVKYTITKSQTVLTPEGTTYEYSKHGSYVGGVINGRNAGSGNSESPEPSNILKIDSVTDRHGNTTAYSYDNTKETTNAAVFAKLNGTASEDRLTTITMPNGHELTFQWGSGTTVNRIISAKDNTGSGQRTINYSYTDMDVSSGVAMYLTQATTPMGRPTTYGYEGTYRPSGATVHTRTDAFDRGAEVFLRTITDCRGLTTKLYNVVMNRCLVPYFVSAGQGVCTVAVLHPNGTSTHLYPRIEQSAAAFANTFPLNNSAGGGEAGLVSLLNSYFNWLNDTNADDFEVPTIVMSAPVTYDSVGHRTIDQFWDKTVPIRVDRVTTTEANPEGNAFVWTRIQKVVAPINPESDYEACTDERTFSADTGHQIFAASRPDVNSYIESYETVNFMGSPLMKQEIEYKRINSAYVEQQTRNTFYAYWGAEKYYQQKAVVDPSGRIAWTDYFTSADSLGEKGQTKEVVRSGIDSGHSNSFGNGSGGYTWADSATAPFGAGNTNWRSVIVPNSGYIAAAKFTNATSPCYDSKGRVTDVFKLQTWTSGGGTYTQTHSHYTDTTAIWGNADWVTEGYNSSTARTTYTNAQDSAGRATNTTDAKGRQYSTTYNLDGQVTKVRIEDNDVNSSAAFSPGDLVNYTYASSGINNGMLISVEDVQTGRVQTFSYYSATSGDYRKGQVSSINDTDEQYCNYNYNANGERERVNYRTWNVDGGEMNKYQTFNNYVSVGSYANPSRVFTNIAVTNSSYVPTAEQMLYEYDVSGRLSSSAFAVTLPSNTSTLATDNTNMTSYAKVGYVYDQGGRTKEVNYDWMTKSGSTWTAAALRQCKYTYDLTKGLRTKFEFKNSSGTVYAENYDYDPNLDYLQGVDYNNNNTYENTWGYDAAGNRITENYGTAKTSSFDNLNRMTASLSGSKTYTHDKVGNRLTMDQGTQRQTMTWDFTNRMTSITDGVVPGSGNNILAWGADSSYEYRADGLRSSKVVHANLQQDVEEGGPSSFFDFNYLFNDATTRYFYDGQMCASEDYVCYSDPQKSDVNEDVTRYMLGARGIDMIEAVRVHGASGDNSVGVVHQSFPIYDGHGNMLATLVRSGTDGFAIGNEKRYDAWGAAFVSSGPGGALVNPNTSYCANLGHKEDSESGLTYMRARYYEPGTGRFISEDADFDGNNWYQYCRNSPINAIDSKGKEMTTIAEWRWGMAYLSALGLSFYGSQMARPMVIAGLLLVLGITLSDVQNGWSGSQFSSPFERDFAAAATAFLAGAAGYMVAGVAGKLQPPEGGNVVREAVGVLSAYSAICGLLINWWD